MPSLVINWIPANPQKEVKIKYGNCYRCKEFNPLDPHHRVKRKNDKEGKYVVYLCRECHDYVETHPEEAKKEGLHIPYYDTEEYKLKYGRKEDPKRN